MTEPVSLTAAPLTPVEQQHYRALFETMDEGFCVIEFLDGPHGPLSDYIHVEANPAYERHAGIPDVVGQKVRDMVPDEADGWIELYGAVLRTGEPIRFERELVATGRHLALSAFRIEPPSLRQVAVLFQDVTARRQAEAALWRLNETLESRVAEALAERGAAEEALRQAQKMEAVGQLTGGLAHDFNNLLAAITGALEMIETRLGQGRQEDVQRYLTVGQSAARRAAGLTHRLLAFSRRQTLSPRALVINSLLTDLVTLVKSTVGPSIAVETRADPDLWATLVDANQLENALLNLCINARDAMPERGRIVIETANRTADAAAAKGLDLDPGQYVVISVADTGSGIEEADLARVFDPFFTTKPLGEGTGLGLSMVYGFARQSNGQARIESRAGEGTKVSIWLPRHVGEAEAPEAVAGLPPPVVAGRSNVLVVDDEPGVRLLIVDALTEIGCVCLEAADGGEALELLTQHPELDLLITDVGLPGGLNGRQVADAARGVLPNLKVLFVTGYAAATALGQDQIGPGMEVLTKPFGIGDLAARVGAMLNVAKSPA